jgi:hypothetical protein
MKGPEGLPVTVGIDPVGCCAAAGICLGLKKNNPKKLADSKPYNVILIHLRIS